MTTHFNVTERIEKRNGVIVKHEIETRCGYCNAILNSSEDWSRHQSMHTLISLQTLHYHNPGAKHGQKLTG